MRKLRVAIVHNTMAPYRHSLFEQLSKKLDLVVYYCSVRHSFRKWDLLPRQYYYKYRFLPGILIGDICINPSIVKRLISDRPDVLVLGGYVDPTMWLAFAIARLLKIHLAYWTEGTKEPQTILGVATRPLRTLFVKKSNAIVVPGRSSRNYVVSLGSREEKVFFAPNAIDNKLFIKLSHKYEQRKDELKSQLGLRSKIIILCVSQFIERKGIKYLLFAYNILKREIDDIALLLIGSGPSEFRLRSIANRLKLRDVRFVKSGLSSGDLVKFYSTADIFVQPTLEDVWGFVINEAMTCGLPVVATRASQAAQEMILPGENGYLVKEANSSELCRALKNLICNPRLRKEMGEKSREIVKCKFGVSQMVRGFLSAIEYCTKDMQE